MHCNAVSFAGLYGICKTYLLPYKVSAFYLNLRNSRLLTNSNLWQTVFVSASLRGSVEMSILRF